MSDDDTPHGRLLGLSDEHLRSLAPGATHQHRRGGLYRDLGIPVLAEGRTRLTDPRGMAYRAWQHLHPHEEQVMLRPIDEDDRFRRLD